MHWKTVTIVGVGLIGGSIGLALNERRLADNIIGVGRRPASLQQARRMGAVTETHTDLIPALKEADLVVVCTPVETVPSVVEIALEHAPQTALITDVGSVKSCIVQQVDQAVSRQRTDRTELPEFIGSHPMAGSEKGGVEFARADLFVDRPAILTPTDQTTVENLSKLQQFWDSIGAKTFAFSPEKHDLAVADVSHLPHLIASVLAAATPEESLGLASTGWLDTTRIASGDVELWRQILIANRAPTLQALARFEKVLSEFRMALEQNNTQPLAEVLAAGKRRRDSLAS